MRDISSLTNKILERIIQYDRRRGKTFYTPKEQRVNLLRAQTEAIRYKIIPDGYEKFNINDLTGYSRDNEELLSNSVAAKAKAIPPPPATRRQAPIAMKLAANVY